MMRRTLQEAVSKQQIIKALSSSDFDVNKHINELESLWKEQDFKYLEPPEIVWTYVLKFMSILKKFSSGIRSKVVADICPFLWLYSYITEKKYISSLSSEHRKIFEKFMKLKFPMEMVEWYQNDYLPTYQEIVNILIKNAIKSWYKPLIKGKGYEIYEIFTHEQARAIAADTQWCVAGSTEGELHCKNYTSKTRLFALIFDDNKKFLLTVPKEEYWNDLNELATAIANMLEIDPNREEKYLKQAEAAVKKLPEKISNIINNLEEIEIVFSQMFSEKFRNYMALVLNKTSFTRFIRQLNSMEIDDPNLTDYYYKNMTEIVKKEYLKAFKEFVMNFDFKNLDMLTFFEKRPMLLYQEADLGEKIIDKLDNNLRNKYYLLTANKVFEFADKNNNHISFVPYFNYYKKISPYIEEFLEWIVPGNYPVDPITAKDIILYGAKYKYEKKVNSLYKDKEKFATIYKKILKLYEEEREIISKYENKIKDAIIKDDPNSLIKIIYKYNIENVTTKNLTKYVSIPIANKIDFLKYKDDPMTCISDIILHASFWTWKGPLFDIITNKVIALTTL